MSSDLYEVNEYNAGGYDPSATPRTEAIRATYATDYYMTEVRGGVTAEQRAAAFDAWLAVYTAEKQAEALARFADDYQDAADWNTPADIEPDLLRAEAQRLREQATELENRSE